MDGKDIITLAASFAAGGITADAISEHYGDGVLGAVLGLVGGTAVGGLTSATLNAIDRETGIIGDVGGLIDDVFSIF